MMLSEAIKLVTFIVVAGMMAALIKTILELRKSPLSIRKRAIVSDTQEFLSVWEIAHQWEGMDPAQTDQENVSPEIKRRISRVLQAYFRKELPLRKPDGYRLTGHHWLHTIFHIDNHHEKLSDDLGNDKVDMRLMDCLYVRRGEILQWCAREFIDPPPCWALPAVKPQTELPVDEEGDDDKDGWYEQMTPRRKTFVAGLEIAKYLWKQDRTRTYKDVFEHPLMKQTGFASVFSLESFKKHAGPVAPDEIKKGGRRPNSST